MGEIDKRKRLSEEPFAFEVRKKGTVAIFFEGKQIKMIRDKEAERLIAKISKVENNITEVQLLLAKITGNFKHGNEKLGKNKSK
ncbi:MULTISPECIES: hypothetical protein [Planococcus]|uniref:Uncharacterized protein n=1 Tax=Planococcus faecalis TaxID=1598147 RepID=A0ABN4XU23_9BACL|nr:MULTISPECIES: hypothetical protein [Planococcus]AQU80734.1 hypothetical protein AJGP001_16200 [Planococcus faecalis]MDJ0331950.1 hypothetical protein [Planococcus sp. S3-L1]OHX55725.1 hypothetical protein BB777_00775 [Planococcus faecalis]